MQIKRVFLRILLFTAIGFPALSQTAISLKEAIPAIASDIGNRLASGTIIAVVNFDSASEKMNDHALGELVNALVNERSIIVVGRGSDLEKALNELNLNLSPDFNEEKAQRIGHLLGAQMVVYGSLRIAGEYYRLLVQVLEVQTAVVRYSETLYILNDRQVRTLMGDFTLAERAGAAALNMAFGAGSFIVQKDPRGGAVTAALEGIGVAAVITSFFLVKETKGPNDSYNWEKKRDTSLSTPVLIGGLAAYGAGAIYGVYRALSNHKPGVNVAEAPIPWYIALVPAINGNAGARLSYTLRF